MAVRPLRPATDRRLGEPLPHQLANRTRAPLQAPGLAVPSFDHRSSKNRMSCGISPPFGRLSPTQRQITHALLTRLPLYSGRSPFTFDLHVLGTPPALILSQDQTLKLKCLLAPHCCSHQRYLNVDRLLIGSLALLLIRCPTASDALQRHTPSG